MSDIDTLLLTSILSNGLQNYGITDDVFKTEAVSTLINKLVNAFQNVRVQQQGEVQQLQQKQNELLDSIDTTSKITGDLLDALKDKASPQPLPQQDMNAPEPEPEPEPEQPAPQEQTPVLPAPDAGMMPPPEMNVPPAPDMGMPAPDAGIQSPAPDMMQFDPSMIGAVQQGF